MSAGFKYALRLWNKRLASWDEMQKVVDRKIVEQKDSRESNIQAVHHFPCNIEKGSKRT